MSIHRIQFYANTLLQPATAIVILPENKIDGQVALEPHNHRYSTLWLLHGLADDNEAFIQNTAICQYANQHNLAVVLPNMARSFYTDMVHGPQYWTYLTQELMPRLQFDYPLATTMATNYVAGTSMGGYGALKWFLTAPHQFQGLGLLSPVVDTTAFNTENPQIMPDYSLVFNSENSVDFKQLLTQLTFKTTQKIYHSIGQQDFLRDQNEVLRPTFQASACQYRYVTYQGGHDWQAWNPQLAQMLDWLL